MLDKDLIMNEVHTLAAEARERGPIGDKLAEAAGVKDSQGVVAPIFMGRGHEVIPEKYIIHFKDITCAHCGRSTRDDTFYSLVYIRSRINGTRVRNLTPIDAPIYNVSVEVIRTGTRTVPYCSQCDVIDLSHLPPPPEPAKLYDFPEATLKGAKPRPAADKKEPKKAASLDDLI